LAAVEGLAREADGLKTARFHASRLAMLTRNSGFAAPPGPAGLSMSSAPAESHTRRFFFGSRPTLCETM
jgi:hypothetical protein